MTEEASPSSSDPADEPGRASEPDADPYAEIHRATDPRELRALAHPVRIALYEALAINPTLTATQASKLVGGSPTSVAYHLRTLAKYGYVEEAEGGAGRERPWRLTTIGYSFDENDPNPESRAVAGALSRMLFKRWLERREDYLQHREQWSAEVRDATSDSNMVLIGTVEEFRELQRAWGRLVMPYFGRIRDEASRPEGSQVFELQLFTHPLDTTAYEIEDDQHDRNNPNARHDPNDES